MVFAKLLLSTSNCGDEDTFTFDEAHHDFQRSRSQRQRANRTRCRHDQSFAPDGFDPYFPSLPIPAPATTNTSTILNNYYGQLPSSQLPLRTHTTLEEENSKMIDNIVRANAHRFGYIQIKPSETVVDKEHLVYLNNRLEKCVEVKPNETIISKRKKAVRALDYK